MHFRILVVNFGILVVRFPDVSCEFPDFSCETSGFQLRDFRISIVNFPNFSCELKRLGTHARGNLGSKFAAPDPPKSEKEHARPPHAKFSQLTSGKSHN